MRYNITYRTCPHCGLRASEARLAIHQRICPHRPEIRSAVAAILAVLPPDQRQRNHYDAARKTQPDSRLPCAQSLCRALDSWPNVLSWALGDQHLPAAAADPALRPDPYHSILRAQEEADRQAAGSLPVASTRTEVEETTVGGRTVRITRTYYLIK